MTAHDRQQRAADFAALHQPGKPFLLPNAWDVASAVLLGEAGFPAIGTTSLAVNAAAGLIDGTATGRAQTMALASTIVPRVSVPVTVDLEGGYSDDPKEVAELAAELASIGVVGINLEDVGVDGQLRPPAVQAAIIGAVLAAAPDLFVNARTDLYWLNIGLPDGRLAETIQRLRAYQDAGARGVFVPALTPLAAIAAVTEQVRLPLNVLWHPDIATARLAAAGVARVSTGSAPYRRALAAAVATAVAARDGREPPALDVSYSELQARLQAAQERRARR